MQTIVPYIPYPKFALSWLASNKFYTYKTSYFTQSNILFANSIFYFSTAIYAKNKVNIWLQ